MSSSSTFVSAPTLVALPRGSHPTAVDAWNEGSLLSELKAIVQDHNVQFALLGLFRVAGLCYIDGDWPATVVIAVRPGSLPLASAREIITHVCLLLQR